jgi:hypothetical protein
LRMRCSAFRSCRTCNSNIRIEFTTLLES